MFRKGFTLLIVFVCLFAFTNPVSAITFGEFDGNTHPNVGSIVLFFPGQDPIQFCSGTLIAPQVFLTASHCVGYIYYLAEINPEVQSMVTFDPTISASGTYYTGQFIINPNYRVKYGMADPGDIAVVLLDQAPEGIIPAKLPTAGLLDQLKEEHILKDTLFTAVGYGDVRDTIRTGMAAIHDNLDRNHVNQSFLSLTDAWLLLSMNPSTGDGGTAGGDSGGPHFIHLNGVETDIVVSITITGDIPCKALDKTYRLDSESARNFLGQFIALP